MPTVARVPLGLMFLFLAFRLYVTDLWWLFKGKMGR